MSRLLAGAAVLAASLAAAQAGDTPIRADPEPVERVFAFAGADLASDSAFVWAGFVGAPRGGLQDDGPRVRVMGGLGRYRYGTGAVQGGVNQGRVTSGEIMLGYRRASDPVAVTAYLGAHMESQRLAAPDPGNRTAGTAIGVKAAMEIFLRLDPAWSASGSASASTVHRAYHARAALMREHPSGLAAGIEAAVHGDARYHEPRGGLFVQKALGRGALTFAGGVLSNSDKGRGLYATVSLYAPY